MGTRQSTITWSNRMDDKKILDGVRVLTLEQVHALPWGTGFLADYGAEVIRVESADHLQDRKAGPFPEGKAGEEWWNEGGSLVYYGTRNKRSLCLDVTDPRGKGSLPQARREVGHRNRQLPARHHGTLRFRPRKPFRDKPRIITLSSTAYGYTGPLAPRRVPGADCGRSVRPFLPHRV